MQCCTPCSIYRGKNGEETVYKRRKLATKRDELWWGFVWVTPARVIDSVRSTGRMLMVVVVVVETMMITIMMIVMIRTTTMMIVMMITQMMVMVVTIWIIIETMMRIIRSRRGVNNTFSPRLRTSQHRRGSRAEIA